MPKCLGSEERRNAVSYRKIRILSPLTTYSGLLLTAVLIGLFVLGESSVRFWLLASVGLLVWTLWAYMRPVHAFAVLVLVWITVYTRSTIPIIQLEGPGNRGGVALGDLLWVGLACAVLLKVFSKKAGSSQRLSVPQPLLFMVPYVFLSCLLPLLGVAFGHWPMSYGLPGIRHLQWASFALFAYWCAGQVGPFANISLLSFSVLTAVVLHMAYSGLQVLAAMKLVSWRYLYLDELFATRFPQTWFFYPRVTGLLVNPNGYGLLGALIFVICVASTLSGLRLPKPLQIALMAGALWSVLLSGSRSAVLGVMGSLITIFIPIVGTACLRRRGTLLRRAISFGFFFMVVLTPLVVFVFAILPEVLRDRLLVIAQILSNGAEVDPNAIGRLEMWSEAVNEYLFHYPFGTWVPPSYALWSPIDSYYVVTLTQGTPLYLTTFVLFLFGVMLMGISLINRSSADSKWVGLTLLGFGGVVAGASFTLSPLLQPEIIALFWSLVGLAFAMVRKVRRWSSQ